MSAATRRRLVLLVSFAFSQIVLFVLLRMPDAPGEGSWLQQFRGYFSYDQLSYASIATTVGAGVPGLPEAFTETNRSFYPSLWYRVLGWLSSATDQSIPALWTIGGWLVLAVAVVVIGWLGYRVSRQAWAPALVGPALTVGTLSVLLHGNWYTSLDAHAVLWGPYGAIYVLNAEVVAFACTGVALAMGLRVLCGPAQSVGARIAWLSGAALLLGITANVQTYAFFVGAGIAFSWLGAYGLLRSRSRLLLLITLAIVGVTFLLGSLLADIVGALAVYGLFLACSLPGIIWLARRHLRLLGLPAVLFVLAAVPQALIVGGGILAEDDFLTYRQGSSGDLGVPVIAGLIATLPIGSVWLFNVLVARRSGSIAVLSALTGIAFSGLMLTFNGAWGFAQEPYRLWIDSVAVSALLLAPLTAWSISRARVSTPVRSSTAVRVVAVAAAMLVGLSLIDFGAFRAFVGQSGVIRFDSARYAAMRTVTAPTGGLIAYGPCVDPQELKIATGKPVAFYNLGIAWPDDKAAIDAVMDAWRAGAFNPDALRAAKVRFLVTDTACGAPWPVEGTMGVVKETSLDYADANGSGTITLWRIA